MLQNLANLLPLFFNLLFFFVPLVLFPNTSEIFEFNKMIVTYLFTILIVASWVIKMISKGKIIFRRTILDIPLLIFIATQLLSFLTSIDPRTSFLGYYSRFHGGLASTISYSLLYWAFVSNMNKKTSAKALLTLVFSAILVSIYAVLEHFGIDKDLWVQDVQTRVFSTLGQPNWLATWIVSLIPITWALALRKNSFKSLPKMFRVLIDKRTVFAISLLFFLTLIYTRSRSGYLGFFVTTVSFWGILAFYSFKNNINKKRFFQIISLIGVSYLFLILIYGSPWTPSIGNLFNKQTAIEEVAPKPQGPALSVGGTESGDIRKIVWKGAIDIWKNYPILGSGVETFAFSYYQFRPEEHNLVSEWDFLYNKAHNEYLNFGATTGTLGLLGYLILIFFIIFQLFKNAQLETKDKKLTVQNIYSLSFLSGILGILVSNIFGFSVVPVALSLFLFPAFSEVINVKEKEYSANKHISQSKNTFIITVLILASIFIYRVGRYWYADILYTKGKFENDSGNFDVGRELLIKATSLSPNEAIFWDELANSSAKLALVAIDLKQADYASRFTQESIEYSQKAVRLSPANVNLKRSQAAIYIKYSPFNPDFLLDAKTILEKAIEQAPSDAKLNYNLALTQARLGDIDSAIEILIKTIKMKDNYRNARFAYALLLSEKGEKEKAIEQLEYILTYIEPNDTLVRQELENIK